MLSQQNYMKMIHSSKYRGKSTTSFQFYKQITVYSLDLPAFDIRFGTALKS